MLLTEETKKVINLAEIGRGSLISAKNKTWDKAQSGIVTEATVDTITVLFLPETQNIQNHFVIQAEAIEKGMWTIRYSSDGMETVNVYEGSVEMDLNQLLYRRLSQDNLLNGTLAKYADKPAIFNTEFPPDQQEGWNGEKPVSKDFLCLQQTGGYKAVFIWSAYCRIVRHHGSA